MATIVAVRTGNWSDTSHLTGPWPGASTPTTKPAAEDTVESDNYTITIDEDIAVTLLRATGSGYFAVASAPRAITANLELAGTYTNGGLRANHATGTVTVNGGAINNSVTAGSMAFKNHSTGTLTITGNLTGGTTGYGTSYASTGIINIGGNVVAGAGGLGVYNSSTGTINIAGNCTGGSAFGAYGAQNVGTGTINITGDSTGGSAASTYGARNDSTGTITVAGIVYPGSIIGVYGLYGANAGGTTTFKKAKLGGALGSATGGYVKMVVDPGVNLIRVVNSSDNTDYDLSNDYPTNAQVENNVTFHLGTQTGTLVAGSCSYPAVGDVQLGVTFGSTGEYTGTFAAPAVGDVQSGVGYGAGGTEYTGTFVSPAVGDVQAGVAYGASSEYTGTFAVPTEAQVELGVGFGAGGVEFTGTLSVGGGVADWTSDEKAQIRKALGITGTTAATTGTGVLEAAFAALATDDEIADAILKRDWTAVTGEAARSALNALRFMRNKWSISGSTLTVTEEDDRTPAWTAALSSDAGADPVIGSDPA